MNGLYLLLGLIFSNSLNSGLSESTVCVDDEWTTKGDITDLYGTFTSPNYPLTYPNDYECLYIITGIEPHSVGVSFDSFDIEDSVDCVKDRLCYAFFLEDIEEHCACGTDARIPLGEISMNSGVHLYYVKFVTDGDTVGAGWSMQYHFGCWGMALTEDGEFITPAYPLFLPWDMRCTIAVTYPDDATFLEFFIADFDMPGTDGECGDSSLEIFSIVGGFHEVYRLCDHWDDDEIVGLYLIGQTVFTLNSGTADEVAGFRGFKMLYKMVSNDVCTEPFVHTGLSGTVQSINYPVRYYNLKNCTYIIDVGEGNSFALMFRDFDVEQNAEGSCYDSVTIYDGDVRDSSPEMLGTYCGTDLPGPFWPTSHVVSIVLSSDITVGHRGFKAQYFLPDEVKDFVPATGSDVSGNWLRIGFNLISVNNMVFQQLWKTGYLWRFEAYARHADICDIEFEDVTGWIDTNTGVVYFDFGLRPGQYHITFRAYSWPKQYDFSHAYTINIDNYILRGIVSNTNLNKYAVDFIIRQAYTYFTRNELARLKTSLHASIQQLYDDVHLVGLEFSKEHEHGYLKVRAYLRGRGLMTKLRLVCAFVAHPDPFKLCMANGKVKDLAHERKVKVFGREFGHGTDIPCANAMFVKASACSCPCSCKGELNVKLP